MSSENTASNQTRRMILGAAGGLVIGTAAGAALGAGSAPPAPVRVEAKDRFAGTCVLVTGATSGIGRATAELFAAQGARVAFCGRRAELGAEVQDAIRATGGEALYIRADLRHEADVADLITRTQREFGTPGIVIANAGITVQRKLADYSTDDWQDVIDTNLRGTFLTLKHAIPPMLAAGGGTILVTASSAATIAAPEQSIYVASKAGLVGLVRSAALDYADQGLRINAVLPGTTDTALVRGVAGMADMPDAVWQIGAAQWGRANIPGVKRMAQPSEIASFIVAMAGPELTFLAGDTLSCDGGLGVG